MYVFLSHCRQIEILASNIYLKFARNTGYSDEVSKVFQTLSDDERRHARNIDLILQSTKAEVDALPRIARGKLTGAKDLAEELFRVACREEINEERALQIAVQIEQEFLKVHIQNVLQFDNPKLAELFDRLHAEDQRHIDTLNGCLNSKRRPDR